MMLEGPMESGNFDEAFNHSDVYSKTKRRSVINKEFQGMNVIGVWKKINKYELPDGR
jgi:hypothetical protein